jgi:VWFA-related protein
LLGSISPLCRPGLILMPRNGFSRLCDAFLPLALLLAIPSSAPCQAGTQQAEPQQTAPAQTSVVNVNEVTIDLVARSKNGKLVPSLQPQDVTVTDGGTPVKLSSLHLVTGGAGDHFVTMVFDRLDVAGDSNAREIAGKILKTIPPTGFSFSVTKANGRLLLYQDFTSDRRILTDAIIQATDEEKPEAAKVSEAAEKRLISIARTGSDETGTRVPPAQRNTALMLLAAVQESQSVMQELHTQPGLASLMALARAEQRLPGRKTVLYFSQGLRSDAFTETRLRDIVGAANKAGISVYVIDCSALTYQADQELVAMSAIGGQRSAAAQAGAAPTTTGSGPATQTVAQQAPGLGSMVNNQLARYESGDTNAGNPLAGMAAATGGSYVAAGADIKKPLRRMLEDMTTYYEASYSPPVENFDGQFRPVVVKPVRAGVFIRSSAGYFALPPDSGQTLRPFEAPLLKLFEASPLPADVAFDAKVLQLGDMPTGNENSLVVSVPMSGLESRDDPNSSLYSMHISVIAQIKNKAGAVIDHFGEDIPRHGSLDSKESARAGLITMQRHFPAEPGDYTLEAAVLDQNSGKTAAQRIEFKVPSVATGPSLSDIALVQRIDPVPEEADPNEPMRYGNGRVVPSISEKVMKGTKELSFFFVVHSDAGSTEPPRLEMEIRKSGESIKQVPLTLRKTAGPATIPYIASIQAAGLPSGNYEVIERLTQAGKTAERSLAFHIQGNDEAESASDHKQSVADTAAQDQALLSSADKAVSRGLVITSLPATEAPVLTPDQVQAVIESARTRALEYGKRLPNFICVETTNRSVDQSGNGNWKHRDSIAELLTYRDSNETRSTLEVNGRRSHLTRAEMNSNWPFSVGEFGAILNLLFAPTSKTEFTWKEAASLGDGTATVQVFSYRVAHENATIVLSQGNDDAAVGFHGLVYIDSTTGGVRRVTLEADGMPHSFAVHAASMSVDYDFVAIADRDYLLPVRATVSLVKGRKKVELNEMDFRNYRRFASRTKLKLAQ